MADHTTDDEDETPPVGVEPEDRSPMLVAEVVVTESRPVECTIFPTDTADFDRRTAWITAEEGSFSSLDEVR